MRIRTITTVGAIATALMLGAALPAVADADQSATPTTSDSTTVDREARAGGVWIYQAANYKQGKKKFTRDDMKFSNNKYHNGKNLHDSASSAKNTSRKKVRIYSDTFHQGRDSLLKPGKKYPHLRDLNVGNDAADSIDFL
ncbi:hypothetical protein [Streptomyces sp. NBC_01304]|uniref:hypothetical protein n=1 Tax=Streptomyces sp. NBC_01304 TaxID=2903818 RepID=UPI002E14B857|nr:hypothetical protein OG430_13415 [Streptomyces sp. NBC_01304]